MPVLKIQINYEFPNMVKIRRHMWNAWWAWAHECCPGCRPEPGAQLDTAEEEDQEFPDTIYPESPVVNIFAIFEIPVLMIKGLDLGWGKFRSQVVNDIVA